MLLDSDPDESLVKSLVDLQKKPLTPCVREVVRRSCVSGSVVDSAPKVQFMFPLIVGFLSWRG